jgi:hypothetical protein
MVRAVRFSRFGGPEVLEIVDLPTLGLDLDLPEDLELIRKFELTKMA